MKKHLSLATVTAVILGCTACSSSDHQPVQPAHSATSHAVSGPSVAAPSSSAGAATPVGSKASGFCDLARKVGKANLGVSTGNLDPDPKKLLTQVDQLDAIAPPDLKKDFDAFAGFEHAVLEPGTAATTSTVRGDPTVALEHVSTYFVSVCRIK